MLSLTFLSRRSPQDAAHQHMLTARALHSNLAQAGNAKFDVLDWSSLIAGARVAAGLDGFDSNKVRLVRRGPTTTLLKLYSTAREGGPGRLKVA